MWPYTDSESDWLSSRKADTAADRPVHYEQALTAHYIREGERLRAEAIAQFLHAASRAIARGARRLFASGRSRLAGDPAQPTA